MLSIVRNNVKPLEKKKITVTGTLTNVLAPGLPAVYLYHGNLVRTTAVEAILEAAPGHVRFETREAVYTLSYKKTAIPESMTA